MHKGGKNEVFRSIEDGTEDHDRSISRIPASSLDVLLDEGDSERNDIVSDNSGKEPDTGSSGHSNIPFVILGIFVLLLHEDEQLGQDLGQGDFGKVLALERRGLANGFSLCITEFVGSVT
jgi:hypothetical protein